MHTWLFPGQSLPFPTNDPRFPGCGRRASRQEDNEGAARGRNGIHLSTEPPMGRSPGCPEPSLRAPGTQFQIQAHTFQLQGVRGPQDAGGGDERSDQHHRASPPTPPSQKPAHHWPSPTQRTGPGRRHLEGRGARRECGDPPCPPARLPVTKVLGHPGQPPPASAKPPSSPLLPTSGTWGTFLGHPLQQSTGPAYTWCGMGVQERPGPQGKEEARKDLWA